MTFNQRPGAGGTQTTPLFYCLVHSPIIFSCSYSFLWPSPFKRLKVSSQDRDESRPTYHANNGQDNSLTRAPPALAMVTSRPATWLRSLAFNGTRKPSGMTRFRIKPLMGGDAGQRRAFGASRPFITTTTASPMAVTSTDFVSKKVIVSLSCQRNLTLVALNFTEPFRGVVQAGDTTSTCKLRGNGSRGYSLPVPHEDCGTKHVVSMVFDLR